MKCPNGSFVAYDKAPGTQAQDCKACPEGKQWRQFNFSKSSFLIQLNQESTSSGIAIAIISPKRDKNVYFDFKGNRTNG